MNTTRLDKKNKKSLVPTIPKEFLLSLENKLKGQGLDVKDIEILKEILLNGDIATGSMIFSDSEVNKLVNWLRTHILSLAFKSRSEKIKLEAFCRLLGDVQGHDEPEKMKIEIVMNSSKDEINNDSIRA